MLREVKLKEDEPSRNLYGIPYRVWYILLACAGIFTFSRYLLPTPDSPSSMYTAHQGVLTPKDYLNASASDPAPFAFCPVFGPNDAVSERRGQWGLLKSRVYAGSGARVQKVIQKAMAGLPVTISVLGGSVSACHGAGDDPISPRCYPSRFFEWWNTIFPHPASELTNGAERKTDSAYFAYCSTHHLPDQTDLIILEFDASDPNDPQWLNHFELLVRSLLVRPDQPAVIILGHFSPQVQAQNGFAGPELLHTVVAQFYDVPHISAKGLLYHDYLANPEDFRTQFYVDPVLANPSGHDLLADLLISYFQSQICAGWGATMGHSFDVPYMGTSSMDLLGGTAQQGVDEDSLGAKVKSTRVPQAKLPDRPSDILRFREVSPFCVSANDLINPLPPSLFFGSGWLAHHPTKGNSGEEEKHYWYSEVAGSKFRVPVQLSAGDVAIYYIQNPESKALGRAACWVDDNMANAVELTGTSDVPDTTLTLSVIDAGVAAGSHFVECSLLGPEGQTTAPFKILGM